jgi:hypothetical protein
VLLKILLSIALVLPGSLYAAGSMTAWEEYLQKPTPERAARIRAISYSAAAVRAEQQEMDLMLLEVQVLARDMEAVRLALRLRPAVDGHFAEMIDIMLGRLIRIDAALFLREVGRAGAADHRLDSLVGDFGQEYVDRGEAYAYEAAKRSAALSQVKERSLKKLRDQCIATLKKISL